MLALGWFPAKDFTIYGGFGFSYNPNGQVADAFGVKGGTDDRFAADLVLAAAYFAVDKFPFALGPELAVGGNLAPGLAFYNSFVEPAVALRYAPFTAANGRVGPLIVGTDLGVQFLFVGSPGGAYKNPTISSVATGLHLIFPL
jgi:hypothetical protein